MTPRRFLSPDELTADLARDAAVATSGFSLSPLEDRVISYRFSDASVGRDQHTIAADAWVTANFERNPVFLWAHQDDELPIGRVEGLDTANGQLLGQVRYADHDFADTVYSLVKGGYLNATSTGWLPLQWKAANDRARPGGLDFTRVELLEISQVPVPALPTALVTARKAGIDTRPLVAWAERLLDMGNFAVLPKAELEVLRRFAAEPRRSAVGPHREPVERRQSAGVSAPAALAAVKQALDAYVDAAIAELIDKAKNAKGADPKKVEQAVAALQDVAATAKAKIAEMDASAIGNRQSAIGNPTADRRMPTAALRDFNPDEARDDDGKWSGDGSGSGGSGSGSGGSSPGMSDALHKAISHIAVGAALIAGSGLIEAVSVGGATIPAGVATTVGLGMIGEGVVSITSQALDELNVHPDVKADVMKLAHDTAAAIKASKSTGASRARRSAQGGWTCGAARDLDIDHTSRWDGAEATARMLDAATKSGEIDADQAKRGFVLYDASNAGERGGYKEPFADIVDGKLVASASGIRAAAQRLPDVKGASDAVLTAAKAVIDAYEAKLTKHDGDEPKRDFSGLARRALVRGLDHVAEMAMHLRGLEGLHDRMREERDAEGDGSPNPEAMRAWLDDGHDMLRAMCGEETQEYKDGAQAPEPHYWSASDLATAVRRALEGLGIKRKGAKYSKDTIRCLRGIRTHVRAAHDDLTSILSESDDANPENEDDDPGLDDEENERARRARALAAKFGNRQ